MQAVQIDNSKTPCKGNSINNQCFFPSIIFAFAKKKGKISFNS